MEEKLQQVKSSGLIRVVLYGPESTGKTTLARLLAMHYDTEWVPEYAREYLEEKMIRTGVNCLLEDILPIAIGQQQLENRLALQARHHLLVCDTDLLTTKAYSDLFYGESPPELNAAIPHLHHDLYLLTDIDVPWQADAIRDRPDSRAVMLAYFEELLHRYGKRYVKISGNVEERLQQAIPIIDELLGKPV